MVIWYGKPVKMTSVLSYYMYIKQGLYEKGKKKKGKKDFFFTLLYLCFKATKFIIKEMQF